MLTTVLQKPEDQSSSAERVLENNRNNDLGVVAPKQVQVKRLSAL
jgi:hypothetical protein